MNKLLLSLMLLFTLPAIHHAQCSIRDLVVNVSECSADLIFNVEINFIYSETSDSFYLRGNGNNYGTFAYSNLPVTIENLTGGCDLNYEFEVRDKENESCFKGIDAGKLCCMDECNIEITDAEFEFCDNAGIDFTLNVERSGTTQSGFDLYSGNTFVGYYNYDDLPLHVENFPSSNTAIENIIVCNNDQPGCCDTLTVETPCGCAFLDKRIKVIDCNMEEETFFVSLDFIPQMLSDSFFVGGNNTSYGTFAYAELPITIGPLPFSESTRYEFVFLDRISTFCFDFIELGIVNNCIFPCYIDNVTADIDDCMDGAFMVNISFESGGTLADSFSIRGNGQLFGRFAYGNDSYQIGPLEGDCETNYEFIVIDDNEESCRDFTGLGEVVCCTLPCPLNGIQTELNCNTNSLVINIDTNDSGDADSVYVFLNQSAFVSIGYNEFPYVYELDGTLTFPIEIRAVDPINNECVLEKLQENTCNNCEIGALNFDILGCDDSNTNILSKLNFEHNQNSAGTFSVYVYADLIGTYKYSELPVELPPFPNPNFQMQITVIDGTKTECRRNLIVEAFTCSSSLEDLEVLGITYFQSGNQLTINDPKNVLDDSMILDLSGRLLVRDFNKISLNQFPEGLYLLYLRSGKTIATEKIFIHKQK